MADLYRETMAREKQITKMGYQVKTIWECDFDRLLKSDGALRIELDAADIVTRLDPRDSLFGMCVCVCVRD